MPEAPDQRLRLPALLEYRAASALRRTAAFVEGDDMVLGQITKPLTPATFSLMVAHRSRFFCGGGPAAEGDVRNYLWFHSPNYAPFGVRDWRERKEKALWRLSWILEQPWRRWLLRKPCVHRYTAVLQIAVAEIRHLINEAWADASPASGTASAPLASLEAQMIHEFAAAYGWPPERTRHTPLRQLFQIHRCIRAARGEDVKDAGEQAIIAGHLQRRLADLQAKQQAAKEAVPHG